MYDLCVLVKGQCHKIFDSINPPPPQGPYSQAKAVSYMASNSPINSIQKSPKSAQFLVTISYVYTCICFCCSIPLKELGANNRCHEGFLGVIKDFTVLVTPLNPLQWSQWKCLICFGSLMRSPYHLWRSHWDRRICFTLIYTFEKLHLFL
jgi:hypothetical protein